LAPYSWWALLLLIVDTNRIIAAIIRDSYSRRVFFSKKCRFLTPEFALQEITLHHDELLSKSGLSEEQFGRTLHSVLSRVQVVNDAVMVPHFEEAKAVMDPIDPADTRFIALALSSPNDGIWTEDRHFERQNVVRVWKTAELLQLI